MVARDKKVWAASIRREQLLEMLEGHRLPLSRLNDARAGLRHENKEIFGLWWGQNAAALTPFPQAIVASPDVLDDLFAWSSSYLRDFGALSSITRIMTYEQFNIVNDASPPDEPWIRAGSFVGLVVGEFLFRNSNITIEAAVAAAANSTLSFAMIRGWHAGFSDSVISEIYENYCRLFRGFRDVGDEPAWLAVRQVAYSLLALDQKEANRIHNYSEWMRALQNDANIFEVARDIFASSGDLFTQSQFTHIAKMTAEERVTIFDKFAPLFVESKQGKSRLDRAFALAFAAFICRPGFEQQAGLMREYAQQLPESWLWLGAFQGLSSNSGVFSLNFGGGWRIARELAREEPLWVAPRTDASLTELEVLARSKSKVLERISSRSRLEVEIFPTIYTAVRNPSVPPENGDAYDRRSNADLSQRNSIAFDKVGQARSRLEEALHLLNQLFHTDSNPVRSNRKRK